MFFHFFPAFCCFLPSPVVYYAVRERGVPWSSTKGYVADFGADIYDELAEIHLQQRNLDRVRLTVGNEEYRRTISARYRKTIEDAREKIWRKMAKADAMLAIVLDAWQDMSGADKGELIEFIQVRLNSKKAR